MVPPAWEFVSNICSKDWSLSESKMGKQMTVSCWLMKVLWSHGGQGHQSLELFQSDVEGAAKWLCLKIRQLRNCSSFGVPEFRLACICHCLNLIAETGFDTQKIIVDKVIYQKCPKGKSEFRKFSGMHHSKLPLNVCTRWNSKYRTLIGTYAIMEKLDEFLATHIGKSLGKVLTATELSP